LIAACRSELTDMVAAQATEAINMEA
jgi:hypothetical protein